MHELSPFRLNLLRAMYLLLAVGNAVSLWPRLLGSGTELEHMRGVVHTLLGALALVALLGLRHPLAMLPLLLFELAWKVVWLVRIGLPLWWGDRLTPALAQSLGEILVGVVLVPLVIPWRYVWTRWIAGPGEPWRR